MRISRFNFAKTWFHKTSPLTLRLTSLNMTFAYSPTRPLSILPSIYPPTHPPSFCLYTSVHPTVHHPSFHRSVPVAGAPELTEALAQPPNTAAEPPHWPCAFPSLSSFPPAPSGAAGSTERVGEGGRGLPGEAAGRCRAPSHAGRSCRPRATPASYRFGDRWALARLLGCRHLCPGHSHEPEMGDPLPVFFG